MEAVSAELDEAAQPTDHHTDDGPHPGSGAPAAQANGLQEDQNQPSQPASSQEDPITTNLPHPPLQQRAPPQQPEEVNSGPGMTADGSVVDGQPFTIPGGWHYMPPGVGMGMGMPGFMGGFPPMGGFPGMPGSAGMPGMPGAFPGMPGYFPPFWGMDPAAAAAAAQPNGAAPAGPSQPAGNQQQPQQAGELTLTRGQAYRLYEYYTHTHTHIGGDKVRRAGNQHVLCVTLRVCRSRRAAGPPRNAAAPAGSTAAASASAATSSRSRACSRQPGCSRCCTAIGPRAHGHTAAVAASTRPAAARRSRSRPRAASAASYGTHTAACAATCTAAAAAGAAGCSCD